MIDTSSFLKQLAEALELEEKIELSSNLKAMPEYDSLAVMLLLAFVSDQYSVNLSATDVEATSSIKDLISYIESKKDKSL